MTKTMKISILKFTRPSQMLVAAPATEVPHPAADLEVPVALAVVQATVRFRVKQKRRNSNQSNLVFLFTLT